MAERDGAASVYVKAVVGLLALAALALTALVNYLLFHSIAELFSASVGIGVFMLAWNARRIADNDYLLFIGISLLFVGVIDVLHTLSCKGVEILPGYTANLPT